MLATAASPATGEVDPGRVVQAARLAQEAGFDGVYVGDHLLHPHPILESVVTLAVIAARTERISFGPCVMLLGLRSPAALAKQLGTLAAFAPGRLRVGVGVGGEYPAEFDLAGVALSRRGQQLESALTEVRSLLRSDAGYPDATIAPLAPQVPFLLAGWKEASLRRAATLGDGWIGYLLAPDAFARRRAFLLECRAALGRSDSPFTTGMLLPTHVSRSGDAHATAAAAWASLTRSEAGFPERLFVAGEPDDVVGQLHRYWREGCTEFVLAPADQGDGYLDQVGVLAREVLPQIRAFR
jgi:alkanesulfonate monooxygenase SsuD/methylene tetrahydromethanopterin reductase-like flavin-dependent oxidoreductase (luciferase family)